jgi:hypothetical protein
MGVLIISKITREWNILWDPRLREMLWDHRLRNILWDHWCNSNIGFILVLRLWHLFFKHMLINISFRFKIQIVKNLNILLGKERFCLIFFPKNMSKEKFVALNSFLSIHNIKFEWDFGILLFFLINFFHGCKILKQL